MLLVLLFGLILQALPAWASMDYIVAYVVLDDTFYYLKTALNAVQGLGLTFDGLNLTNGFQPLWMGLLLGLAHFVREPMLLVRTTIVVCALLNAGTSLVIYSWLRGAVHRAAAFFAAAAWTFTMSTLGFGTTGLETSLYGLMLALALYACYRVSFKGRWGDGRGYRSWLGLGLACGLLVLARLDAILLLPFLLLAPLAAHRRALTLRTAGLALAFALAPLLLLIGSYLVWNWVNYGILTPISGMAKMYDAAARARTIFGGRRTAAFAAKAFDTGWSSLQASYALGWGNWWPEVPAAGGVWTLLQVAILFTPLLPLTAAWRQKRPLSPIERLCAWLTMLWPFALAQLAFFSIFLWNYATYDLWHYMPVVFLISLWGSLALVCLLNWVAARVRLPAVGSGLAVLLVLWICIGRVPDLGERLTASQRPTQAFSARTPIYEGALWVRDHLPPEAVLGAWNAGILGYFSGHRVIDLDCVINSPELLAWYQAQRPFMEYLHTKRIEYVVDMIEKRDATLPGLDSENSEFVHRIPAPDPFWDEIVFRIR